MVFAISDRSFCTTIKASDLQRKQKIYPLCQRSIPQYHISRNCRVNVYAVITVMHGVIDWFWGHHKHFLSCPHSAHFTSLHSAYGHFQLFHCVFGDRRFTHIVHISYIYIRMPRRLRLQSYEIVQRASNAKKCNKQWTHGVQCTVYASAPVCNFLSFNHSLIFSFFSGSSHSRTSTHTIIVIF